MAFNNVNLQRLPFSAIPEEPLVGFGLRISQVDVERVVAASDPLITGCLHIEPLLRTLGKLGYLTTEQLKLSKSLFKLNETLLPSTF